MKNFLYMIIIAFILVSSILVIYNYSERTLSYEINGTIYSCIQGFKFNQEKLICEKKQ